MEHSTRLAHISEDGTRTQTVYDHLAGTARPVSYTHLTLPTILRV